MTDSKRFTAYNQPTRYEEDQRRRINTTVSLWSLGIEMAALSKDAQLVSVITYLSVNTKPGFTQVVQHVIDEDYSNN